MNIDKMIEQWEEKHASLLDEYSKGSANNEVMQMYRSQMKNVLDFINQLKKVKNCFIPVVSKSVCDVGEVFISCCRFDDNSKIGCAYCNHFKQTVL